MTTAVAASPIALSTTVVDANAAATGASTNAEASAETDSQTQVLPPLSGGFQLLIDAAAEQQTALSLAQNSALKTSASATAKTDESGNALPLLGALLPTLADAAAGQPTDADGVTQGATDNADDDGKTDAATPGQSKTDNSAVQLLWTPINIQPPLPVPQQNAAPHSKPGADVAAGLAIDAAGGGAAPIELPSADAAKTASPTDDALSSAEADAAQQQANTLAPNKPAAGERNNTPRAEVLTTPASNAVKQDVSPQDLIGATQKPADTGASFADLLKPANAATANPNPLTAPVENARAQQAARPYVEMNSTGASVAIPVGSSGWSDAVVDKVMWFSANKFSSAEIQLNPPDLGPLQVRISTQHDQASVVFSSPHAAVRDALDQALPRLRDMLGGQGIQLSDASVGGQGAQAQQQHQHNGSRQAPTLSSFFQNDDSNSAAPVAVTRVQVPRLSTSAVDAYA